MDQVQKIDIEKADERIVTYLEDLLERKGMGIMPPNILADMLMDLFGRFNNHILLSAMQKMDPEKYKLFDEFIESNPKTEEAQKFLEENVENLDEVVGESMKEFEKIYLGEKDKQD